jgi:Rrf2 family protein
MKLNKTEDYAILILSFLSKEDRVISVTDICKSLNLPIPFTRKILNMLLKQNLVKGVEGSNGGYMLEQNIEDLSLYDILDKIGYKIAITKCIDSSCVVSSVCMTKNVFQKLNDQIILKFREIKMKDFITN